MDAEGSLAVAAHRWLNMASVILSGAETLLTHHEGLPTVARDEVLAIIVAKANQLEDSLIESFSAAPGALRAALQQLQPPLDGGSVVTSTGSAAASP